MQLTCVSRGVYRHGVQPRSTFFFLQNISFWDGDSRYTRWTPFNSWNINQWSKIITSNWFVSHIELASCVIFSSLFFWAGTAKFFLRISSWGRVAGLWRVTVWRGPERGWSVPAIESPVPAMLDTHVTRPWTYCSALWLIWSCASVHGWIDEGHWSIRHYRSVMMNHQ